METTFSDLIDNADHDSEFCKIVLFLFYLDAVNKADHAWEEFAEELIYKNRFSSKNDILEELHKKAADATHMIAKGTILYRARIFDKNIIDSFVKNYVFDPDKATGIDKDSIPKLNLKPQDVLPLVLATDPEAGFEIIKKAYSIWKRKKFKGYNNLESGAPPKEYASAGRANPKCIPYLYLCEDKITPVYEVRPTIGQQVSVAKFKTTKDLRLYDLTLELNDKYDNPSYSVPSLYDSIGKHFSIPNTGNEIQYLPTQFLSEEIKNMGFDGLRFRSSLHSGGINIVLFSSDFCKALSSNIVQVNNIELEIAQPDVYHLDSLSSEILNLSDECCE